MVDRARHSAVMAPTFYTIQDVMKRFAALVTAVSVTLLVLAPAALAHDGGQGWYGPADDKVVTNAGFILIIFFPLFVFVMSMIQWRLEKRKDDRKQAHKARAADEQAWRGGW